MCAMAPEQANEGLLANITTRLSTYLSLRHAWREPAKLYIASLWSNMRSGYFGVLVSPSSVGDKTFAKWWLATSHNFMSHEEAFGVPALVGSAHGVVLDLGAGSARIEDAKEELAKLGVQPGTVDCILSIQVLCSIPNLKSVIKDLHYLLKPGGELIFWEHQQNEVDWITRAVQGRHSHPTLSLFLVDLSYTISSELTG
ncbi:Methyltransferase type 11 [Beauveria bassiana ARSEF 2860]|uniref:Methyltransferase type 11 n=1 Tax=Beauveria bassiana (strain ARSEF 2860) TaxID=655819 RepID=J5JZB2_BEAB2|nr:Methyltransferase type 11 [Beauveria bassiana ARSEF 2860]EJP69718.1 Methyltransferase type 11 [Beauveria bassiana ARSEF 2860]